MLQILTIFLESAVSRILYLALHLETGSFPRPLRAAQERQAFAALQGYPDPPQPASGGPCGQKILCVRRQSG